jgi:hypothetical protein
MLSSSQSFVWNYFEKVDVKSAICCQCDKRKSNIDSTVNRFGNTTNLWRHLENEHTDIFKQAKGNAEEDKLKQSTISINPTSRKLINLVSTYQSKY